jgi:CheY-like chemotaxis protein
MSSTLKILIVDDEEICVVSNKLMLEGSGHEVMIAVNGKEAINLVKKHFKELDLVLLDLMLPDMSGADVLKKINSLIKKHSIKVIVQTGLSEGNDIGKEAMNIANGFIRKPFSFNNLNKKIASVIN